MSETIAVVLAAGKGTRMKSDLPKVLCEVAGRPMVEYVLDALEAAGIHKSIVVVGYQAEQVKTALSHRSGLTFVEQTEQLGTGHAVMVCEEELRKHEGNVLILTGDSPLTQSSSIQKLLDEFQQNQPACLMGTLVKEDPTGLGRIVRDEQGAFLRIVEQKDASEEEKAIQEVNMSTYLFNVTDLLDALSRIDRNNEQKEYYITDCPGILKQDGKEVRALAALHPCEALSVNTVDQLAIVEAEMKKLGLLDS